MTLVSEPDKLGVDLALPGLCLAKGYVWIHGETVAGCDIPDQRDEGRLAMAPPFAEIPAPNPGLLALTR